MKHILTLWVLSLLWGVEAMAQKEIHKNLFVTEPGTLVEQLTREEADSITHLKLSGKINAIDFRHLRDEFVNLRHLDISTASISLYAGKNGTHHDSFYIYPAHSIPAYAFCRINPDGTPQGKESLHSIILSDKTKRIEDAAFEGCNHLEVCQIRKKSAPNLFANALADTLTAIFIPTGCTDAYRIKPGWREFAFIESEPVTVNLSIGQSGSLGSELARLGIQPQTVNFLRIEGKTDEADFSLIRDYMPRLVSLDLAKSDAVHIPAYTFTQKKYLLRITLPSALKSIGQRAFSGCTRLSGIIALPLSVNAIEYGAFMGCPRLRGVSATKNQLTAIGDNLFGEEHGKLFYTE